MMHYPDVDYPTFDSRKIVVWANIMEGKHDTEANKELYERLRAELHALVYKPEYKAIHARVVQG